MNSPRARTAYTGLVGDSLVIRAIGDAETCPPSGPIRVRPGWSGSGPSNSPWSVRPPPSRAVRHPPGPSRHPCPGAGGEPHQHSRPISPSGSLGAASPAPRSSSGRPSGAPPVGRSWQAPSRPPRRCPGLWQPGRAGYGVTSCEPWRPSPSGLSRLRLPVLSEKATTVGPPPRGCLAQSEGGQAFACRRPLSCALRVRDSDCDGSPESDLLRGVRLPDDRHGTGPRRRRDGDRRARLGIDARLGDGPCRPGLLPRPFIRRLTRRRAAPGGPGSVAVASLFRSCRPRSPPACRRPWRRPDTRTGRRSHHRSP